jgi:hypothetical protein
VDIVQGYVCTVAQLRDLPLVAPPGESVIAPVEIEGLPPEIEALGRRWQRKVEFHMTVLGAIVIEAAGLPPDAVAELLGGRRVGPVFVTREMRRVGDRERPGLETIVVMVECPALPALYEELSATFDVRLAPPPAHVTLYSTDPEVGIGIRDEEQLRERAPGLSDSNQEAVRQTMGFDAVFGAEK